MAARRKKPATPVEPPKAEVSGTLVAVIGAALLAGGFLAGRFTVPHPDVDPAPENPYAATLAPILAADATGTLDDFLGGLFSGLADKSAAITDGKQFAKLMAEAGKCAPLGETYKADLGPVVKEFAWLEKAGPLDKAERDRVTGQLNQFAEACR